MQTIEGNYKQLKILKTIGNKKTITDNGRQFGEIEDNGWKLRASEENEGRYQTIQDNWRQLKTFEDDDGQFGILNKIEHNSR